MFYNLGFSSCENNRRKDPRSLGSTQRSSSWKSVRQPTEQDSIPTRSLTRERAAHWARWQYRERWWLRFKNVRQGCWHVSPLLEFVWWFFWMDGASWLESFDKTWSYPFRDCKVLTLENSVLSTPISAFLVTVLIPSCIGFLLEKSRRRTQSVIAMQ